MTTDEIVRERAYYKRRVDEATNPVQRELARQEYTRLNRALFVRWAEEIDKPTLRAVSPEVIGQLGSAEQTCSDAIATLTSLPANFQIRVHLNDAVGKMLEVQRVLRSVLEQHGSDLISPTDREEAEDR